MAQELKAAHPDLNIEILGVNDQSQVFYNYLMGGTNTLPWLQDTSTQNVWSAWTVTWRDVRILDSANRLRAVFNLTTNDLTYATNYATLRQLFLQAAQAVDSDGDGLPDDWELKYFGSLAPNPQDDPDGDGFDNATEFAFGSDPTNPNSTPAPLGLSMTANAPQPVLSITFRRRAGSMLDYIIEASSDLKQWTPIAAPPVSLQNLFDGTGAASATWVLTNPVSGGTGQFLRIHAAPRKQP